MTEPLSLERIDALERLARDEEEALHLPIWLSAEELQAIISMAKASVWRDASEAPKDGSIVYGCEPYRWVAYKPGSSKGQLKRGGRWQKANEFGGWYNAELPAQFLLQPPEQGT